MNRLELKRNRLKRRVRRVRNSIKSKTDRPRLVINRSNRFLSAQIIDDAKGVTICSLSTHDSAFEGASRSTMAAATKLGTMLAEKAKAKDVMRVTLDRRGALYHGKIAAFADAVREGGLEF